MINQAINPIQYTIIENHSTKLEPLYDDNHTKIDNFKTYFHQGPFVIITR